MNLSDEIEKIYNNFLLEYEKDVDKMPETDEHYTSYINYVERMKSLLFKRKMNYEILARELEICLLSDPNIDRVFEKTYKQLDKILNKTIKVIKKYIPRKEKNFKSGFIFGVNKEHEKYVNCFKIFKSEVITNANFFING